MSEAREEPKGSVLRETDESARQLAKNLIRTARFGSLATIDAQQGGPFASLTSVATDCDGAPLILVSRLSGHTGNLLGDARCSLLLGQPGKGDPLAHPRVSLVARAAVVSREGEEGARVRRRFLARHPKSELYVDFPDFLFFRLAPERASLNGGFGRAYELAPADLLTDLAGAEDLVEAEAGAVAHMNEDHAQALGLYATRLLNGPEAPWRCVGIDPEGLDLSAGDLTLRLAFPARVATAGELRKMLVDLAGQARMKA
ncbi:HugZ family protein [Terrarubrum flagellatum]|uniref:HugZ family pyridoxamine 5'-phosphate oxidase n=1 Tax=Terrirubrum flagellatum TaxID=2895980 RepID=UPI00314532DF